MLLPTRLFAVISVMSFVFFPVGSSWPQSQLDERPRLPFTDDGACPFEGCQYGEWTARVQVVARRDANISSPVVFTIRPNEKISALNGRVITRQLGIIKMLKRVVFDEVETSTVPYSTHKVEVPAGAVLYLLHEEGEGYCLYWYNGATHHQDLYAESVHKGNDDFPWDVISVPKTEWWVKVKNHDGRIGWILNPNFQGMDALGGQ
jgi:hypothetical protein